MSEKKSTNDRYKHFTQELFTAGDYEQFVTFLQHQRCPMNPMNPTNVKNNPEECTFQENPLTSDIHDDSMSKLFRHSRWSWSKYACGNDLFQTFEYMFHKFKKGIYVQIVDNELKVFLPFSNVDYRNEYSQFLHIDRSKYSSFEEIYQHICKFEGRDYYPNRVCRYPDQWYCNNGLVRYEYPLKENDSGINMIHDMFLTLCKERCVPDCEFFINKRDFPILSLDSFEPYDALVGSQTPLYSYDLPHYLPILGMTTRNDFADIPIPTWEDWCRCSYQYDKRVFGKSFKTFDIIPTQDFHSKIPTLVFRGSSTGLGTHIHDNPRLFFSHLSLERRMKSDGIPFLDVGITKWNTRPRKQHHQEYLDIPNPEELKIPLVNPLSPLEQSQYKYILHLPGHSFAYRLGIELSMNSVVFLYPSIHSIWYLPMLKPYVHYIPLQKGLNEHEVFEKIQWCDEHPDECKKIAQNARDFYIKYLNYNSTLDYLQRTCYKLSNHFQFHRRFFDMSCHFKNIRNLYLQSLSPQMTPPPLDLEHAQLLKETRQTKIFKYNHFIYKQSNSDLSHAHFISNILQTHLQHLCPNFLYSQHIESDYKTIVFPNTPEEHLGFDTYLKSTSFQMHQFKLILLQIITSLKIAQAKLCFMHYDLTPWNILLFPAPNKDVLQFRHYDQTLTMQHHKFIAKIIDFEYACVLHESDIIHNIQPFFLSENHDIITLLYNSLHIILKSQKLSKDELQWVRTLLKLITRKNFYSVQDMKYFLSSERKFSRILLTNEHNSYLEHSQHISLLPRLEKLLSVSSISTTYEWNDWYFCYLNSHLITISHMTELTKKLNSLENPSIKDVYDFQKCFDIFSISNELSREDQNNLMTLQKKLQSRTIIFQKIFSDWTLVPQTWSTNHSFSPNFRWRTFSNIQSLTIPNNKIFTEIVYEVQQLAYLSNRGYKIHPTDSTCTIHDTFHRILRNTYQHRLSKIWDILTNITSH